MLPGPGKYHVDAEKVVKLRYDRPPKAVLASRAQCTEARPRLNFEKCDIITRDPNQQFYGEFELNKPRQRQRQRLLLYFHHHCSFDTLTILCRCIPKHSSNSRKKNSITRITGNYDVTRDPLKLNKTFSIGERRPQLYQRGLYQLQVQ